MPLTTGQSLSHYEILGPLGAGGMGEVYRARDSQLEREVAIKVLPEEFGCDAERLRRFEREAKTLASLNHPNVAQVYGIEHLEDRCFMAMELVPGEDLAARLSRGALPLDEALDVCSQIAEGVEAAHEAGVIHRDLKPANVVITPAGRIKVLDFGLAKPATKNRDSGSTEDSALTTGAGRVLGTPAYMAPEQARGKPIDRRVDVWAVGCVLYECLTGKRAFGGETTGDALARVLEKEPDWSALPPGVPAHVRVLLARCLDKCSRTRLQDVGEARIALRTPVDAGDEVATSPPGVVPLSTLLVLLAPALVLAVALALILSRGPEAAPGNPLDGPVPRVLALEGTQYDVATNPGGDAVVFGSDRGGSVDMWRWSLEGGAPVNLTRGRVRMIDELVRNVGFYGSVPWAQDNVTLVLHKVLGAEQPLDPVRIDSAVELVLSRDGSRALYHTHEPGDPIYIHGEKDLSGEPVDVGGPGIHLHYPSWSIDEEWIYYSKGVPSIWAMDLWRTRVDGTEQEQLTFDHLDVAFPTPISEEMVLFIAKESDGSGPYIFHLDVPSGEVHRATVGVEHYTSLHASDDGHTVVATRASPTSALWRVPLRRRDEARVQEGDVERLSEVATLGAHTPALRGERLFYLLSYGGGDGLHVLEDGRQRELWEDSSEPLMFPPSVSPSGEKVALVRRGTAVMKLAVVEVSSGRLLADLETAVDVRGACAWSPDEESLIIPGIGPDAAPGLFRIALAGGAWERLSSEPAVDPAWAPDRDLIVFGVNTGGGPRVAMRAVDQEGRAVDVDLSRMAPRFRLGAPVRFTPDRTGLVYLAYQDKPFTQQFFHLDLESGESHQLSELDLRGTIRSFDLSPDGSHIVFDRVQQNSDVVIWNLAESND